MHQMEYTSDTTWSSSNTYILTDIIIITIEAGTTIKGEPKSAGAFDPGTLVITQGSKIDGTAEAPIIFTSTEDDGSLKADSDLGRRNPSRQGDHQPPCWHRVHRRTPHMGPTMPITQAHSSTS